MNVDPYQHFLVFDVEAIGLLGDPFAAGWSLIQKDGSELEVGSLVSDPSRAEGSAEDRAWVEENVFPALKARIGVQSMWTLETPDDLCRGVVTTWGEMAKRWKISTGDIALVVDCGWPVEHRFLERCARVVPGYLGPFPLLDLASVFVALGRDPAVVRGWSSIHLPTHDPQNDARSTAVQWAAALREIDIARELLNAVRATAR